MPRNPAELAQKLAVELDARRRYYPVRLACQTGGLCEHGFCQVALEGTTVDVFLPIVDFYETARLRRQSVRLGRQNVWIWDAESLVIFKMMFFRRKDLADVEQILRQRGNHLDRPFVRNELVMLYGQRDPRLGAWDDLTSEQ